ncbi:PREDICTED: urea transporter 1-like [Polistes dominula]|uniref:Urea transporter 1-like n=1 Tax=Polistes dominula TaxID=743375 RepID=A0ABM1IXG8_POLDO|nr:PREDICTED: urea transporter 1-like [Polistes dominula]
MSEDKLSTIYYTEERPRGACIGDFVLLKNVLSKKNKPIWVPVQLLDALLRGYGQVVFANNPLSGLLIVIALGATAPKILAFSAATGFLGLLLSMLMKDYQEVIENGLTVFNPLLVGALSASLVPNLYGEFDAFSYLLILIGTITSVYLTRSLQNNEIPFTTTSFNLVEILLLFILTMQDNLVESSNIQTMDNATSDGRTNDASFIAANVTDVNVDWGMFQHVFRGMVVSSSQVFGVDNIAAGAVIYLAVLVYSPATAGFSFVGVFIGTLAGLEFRVPHNEVFTGLWGFNSFLTGAALGGNLFVLNLQTAVATLVAIVYTVILQYVLRILLGKIGLPVLTLPFAISTVLFVKLRSSSSDSIFPKPLQYSYPEKQRQDYIASKKNIKRDSVGIIRFIFLLKYRIDTRFYLQYFFFTCLFYIPRFFSLSRRLNHQDKQI